jgi:EmrB/QacA subfamily drug resistance transporter
VKDGWGRWWTLPVVSAAQLLVVLDGTIVNIALPSAQHVLGMSDASRHWVITAYALAFGGLLLIGGRVSSALGHRRTFMIGLAGFAVSSALAGAAISPEMLFATRALQGVFAAVLAPAGLSLLTTTFTEARERGRAFGVFAAVGAAGSAVGLVLGGLLTEYVSWRWCLYINVPIALLALFGCVVVPRDRPTRAGGRLDVPGAVLSASAFVAVVYAFNQAEHLGWGSPVVLGLLLGGVLLLAAFVAVERRAPQPLLPMRVLAHRARAGAFTAITLMFVAMFGFYLFMSYYTQAVLGYSPVQAGLTLIINAIAALLGSTLVAGKLHGRVPPAALIVAGLLAAAAGMLVLTNLTSESTHILPLFLTPALVLTGVGLGCVMSPTASLATADMPPSDIGAASAAYNAAQQLGAALGTALLNTIAISAASSTADTSRIAASVHGYTTALAVGCGILVAAACVTAPLIRFRRETGGKEIVAAHQGFVPVIDLSERNSPDGRRALAAAIGTACEKSGFFTIVGHGVPQALVDRMYATTKAFFELPDAQKDAVASRPGFSGFRRSGGTTAQSLDEKTPPDLCEAFGVHVTGELSEAERAKLGDYWASWKLANLWPSEPAEFAATWHEYTAVMTQLSGDLLHLFALALDLDEEFFDDRFDAHTSSLTANYYYPQLEAPLPGQLRRGPHTDFGALTVLYQQDNLGGLQVRSRSGEWCDVPAIPGSFVVNIGDLMALWTGGRWVSTLHRVVNPERGSRSSRLSIPFFCQPNHDAPIEKADVTAGEWISTKMQKLFAPAS